jgi:zinc D-Ala-D-Ala dipeptidase
MFQNRPWQRISQTMQTGHKNFWVCLVITLAPALVLSTANADGPLVDIQSVNPTIMVDLRYAGPNNLVKHPLYPQGMRALARSQVASALTTAQTLLRRYQYGLKIWDAYRPVAVQTQLWEASHNSDYVANPEIGVGSLHSWGIAVDATLVDSWNRPVSMPSDFDDFTPAAMWRYMGPSNEILGHLRLLQYAMHRAGFYGMRTEWWHFTIADWRKYLPEEARHSAQVCGTQWNGQL